jgi:hypothetical protein
MNLTELFEAIRATYVRELGAVVAAVDAHVEPAFRRQDGSLAVEGALDLPCRADYIPRDGGMKPGRVDSKTRVEFEPFVVLYGNCEVQLSPFTWDWLQVNVRGLGLEEVAVLAKSWFLRWFDVEDENEPNEQGLFGVVHFFGDPSAAESEVRLTLDLGSAPSEALNELLWQLSSHGAESAVVT